MQSRSSEPDELMQIHREIKIAGITSVSTDDLERFTELFTLNLPRSDDPVVRVDKL